VTALLASPFLEDHLLLHPGSPQAAKIPPVHYKELEEASRTDGRCPTWLVDTAQCIWELDVADQQVKSAVTVRSTSEHGYSSASYELNFRCNYECEHCYLGLKDTEALPWRDRQQLLTTIRDAGVLWLQLTGGEPLLDDHFRETYELAHDLGMMITVSSNGSRMHRPEILDLMTQRPPHRVSLSVYGATPESYERLTRRRGSFAAFIKGMTAGVEAGIPIRLNLIVTKYNAHEVSQMQALAESHGPMPGR
jgi:uncharacterized Fe-S cluster-containing radical SAM superfamily protein